MSDATLKTKLDSLECHFTWDLETSKAKLNHLRDSLLDIGFEGNMWMGPIYNLQGFIHHQLGLIEEAKEFFIKAAKFCPKQAPWMVVNYGNLAWLHHHEGEKEKSLCFLEKVDCLLRENPPPSQDELLPEICAEKAWTLMKFNKEKVQLANDYFKRAIKMRPDQTEWKTSRLLALAFLNNHEDKKLDGKVLKEIHLAREEDPENMYLAAVLLNQRAVNGAHTEEEVEELTRRIMQNPVSSYSGFKPLLRLHEQIYSVDEAIELAEEAMESFPEERYLKKCAARCYKRKIIFHREGQLKESLIRQAICLYEELISLYSESSLHMKLDLAKITAKLAVGRHKAKMMYQEMLAEDLEPLDKQMLYYYYANFLYFDRKDSDGSLHFYRKAVEIPEQSFYRDNSIVKLKKLFKRHSREVQEILENLKCKEYQDSLNETEEEAAAWRSEQK